MSPFRNTGPTRFALAGALAALAAAAPAQEKEKPKADPVEKVTIQYRVARDAVAPSQFVAVIDGGTSFPLEVTWDLPKLDDKAKREAQEKEKAKFDDLVKGLEAKLINGVEFECKGEWVKKGFKLRITTIPEATEAGKKRIKAGGG